MEDSSSHHNHTSSSRLGLRRGGEIVEVQGGHIIRSTGRRDRHSKVCTSKGPRDRRVRLAAHTAIQFYDVQDRLGYDRPSKAVDWLINKAKAAIDELDQLPAWHPTDCTSPNLNFRSGVSKKHEIEPDLEISNKIRANVVLDDEQRDFHPDSNSSFLPASLDSDAIADTLKSFFPISASSSSAVVFDNFPTPDLLSRNVTSSQDLRLSLQSFADPILLHHHQNPNPTNQQTQVLLTTGTSLGFEGASSGWSAREHNHQRFAAWNPSAASCYFNPPAPQFQVQHSHNQFFSHRGPLQSSNAPSVHAWMDPSSIANHQYNRPSLVPIYHQPISGSKGGGGFLGFHIPARIQGEDEEHDGHCDKPSSASSDSHL